MKTRKDWISKTIMFYQNSTELVVVKKSIRDQLKQEFVTKSALGSLFHVGLALLVGSLFFNLSSHSYLWSLSLAVITITGIWRYITRRVTSKNISTLNTSQFRLHTALLLITSALWGILAANAVDQFGLYSLEALTLCLIIATLLTGSLPTLCAQLWIHRFYICLMLVPLVTTVLAESTGQYERAVGAILTGFGIYQWVMARYQNQQVCKSIEYKEQMRLDKERLEQVINSIPGFVFSLDEDFNILEHSIGLDIKLSESFSFTGHKRLVATADSPLFRLLQQFIQSKTISATQELLLNESNSPSWYLVSMTRNTQIHGGIVVVGVPINQLKLTQEQLKVQTAKAEYSSRLATLGEMAGGIAHEINNPLAVIMGNATQIIRYLEPENAKLDLAKEKSQKIIQTCIRISKIIQGLRHFSRQGDQDPFVPTSLTQVVHDTLELCRERFYRGGVNIMAESMPDNIEVPARAVQLSQVLLNLLNNAFDAINNSSESENKFVQLNFKKTSDYFSIYVVDSGPGIPAATAARIFEPFFTTKEVGKGTGLGLSISKGIIEEHQGELILHSDRPMTTFEIRLPFHRQAEKNVGPGSKAA